MLAVVLIKKIKNLVERQLTYELIVNCLAFAYISNESREILIKIEKSDNPRLIKDDKFIEKQ